MDVYNKQHCIAGEGNSNTHTEIKRTGIQAGKQTDGHAGKEASRQTGIEIQTDGYRTERERETENVRRTLRNTDRHADTQSYRQTNRQTGCRQVDRRTLRYRQTDKGLGKNGLEYK